MAVYICGICGFEYDEADEGTAWGDLPDDWACPACTAEKEVFEAKEGGDAPAKEPCPQDSKPSEYLKAYRRKSDDLETWMSDIHAIAESGKSISEPMRTKKPVISWDDILVKGAQLYRQPLNEGEEVVAKTVIGPKAAQPLVLESPLMVSHMSFGALSREAKLAMAMGSAQVGCGYCSGEGGVIGKCLDYQSRYIFEYVPHKYSFTEENLKRVGAIEIKFGQSAKPGMGGHLPGSKVTEEIAQVRGIKPGQSITSPAHFEDIGNKEQLKEKIDYLREVSGGKPIGVKLAAGHIEKDIEIALYGKPDFITIDGRAGATGSALKFVKAATSVPTIFALYRARQYMEQCKAEGITLVITGGFRVSSDFVKALALGADVIALATASMIAVGCQQYRVCNTGRCPVGIATQDPELRKRLDVEKSAERLANFLRVSTEELKTFARLTGRRSVHDLDLTDLCTTNSEISNHTKVEHV